MQVACCKMHVARCKMHVASCMLPVAGCRHRLLITIASCSLLAAGYVLQGYKLTETVQWNEQV